MSNSQRVDIWVGPAMARAAKELVDKNITFQIDATGSSCSFAIPTDKTPFPELHLKYALMVDAFPLCPWAYLVESNTAQRVGLPWPWMGLEHALKQCGKRLKRLAAA